MLLYDVLQEGLPMNVVPDWIETKGTMNIVSLRPRYHTMHFSAFRISNSEECLIVKDWSKIVKDRRELLDGSNQKRNPRLGVKTFDYITRVNLMLPLSVYKGTWTHSPPLVAMHLLDRSCMSVGIFLKLHATFLNSGIPSQVYA